MKKRLNPTTSKPRKVSEDLRKQQPPSARSAEPSAVPTR